MELPMLPALGENARQSLIREVRSAIRQIEEARSPIVDFQEASKSSSDAPRFYIADAPGPRRMVQGLRVGVKILTIPDERREDLLYQAVGTVWQLKDHLSAYLHAPGTSPSKAEANRTVNAVVDDSMPLKLCADLFNLKKHGENRNRSGLDPEIGEIAYNLDQSGVVEIYYDGLTKQKELLVSNPAPITVVADIRSRATKEKVGYITEVIVQAFQAWVPLVRTSGALATADGETKAVSSAIRSLLPEQNNESAV